MNELDWWIASQWEMFKIKEGKTGLEFNKTDKEGNVLTVDRTQKWNKLRAKTDLKEMYIVILFIVERLLMAEEHEKR